MSVGMQENEKKEGNKDGKRGDCPGCYPSHRPGSKQSSEPTVQYEVAGLRYSTHHKPSEDYVPLRHPRWHLVEVGPECRSPARWRPDKVEFLARVRPIGPPVQHREEKALDRGADRCAVRRCEFSNQPQPEVIGHPALAEPSQAAERHMLHPVWCRTAQIACKLSAQVGSEWKAQGRVDCAGAEPLESKR